MFNFQRVPPQGVSTTPPLLRTVLFVDVDARSNEVKGRDKQNNGPKGHLATVTPNETTASAEWVPTVAHEAVKFERIKKLRRHCSSQQYCNISTADYNIQ